MPDNMILTLAEWRGLKGYSKKGLAERSGVTERSIYNYEKDAENLKNASYSNIKKLCDALEIKVDQIFLGNTSEKPKKEVN